MWKVTIKGLLAHKLRLALTAIAIVLGVTFISGTYVLTDTLHNTISTLFANVYRNVDFQVRGVAQFTGSGPVSGAVRNPIPDSVLAEVRGVPGVETAAGTIGGYAQFVSPAGKAISNGGAPTLGVSFDSDQRVSQLHIVQGQPPSGPHDVVMDAGTADSYHFHIGQQVRVLLLGAPQTFTITGIARFGTANNLAGATLAAFTVSTAQTVLDTPGQLDSISVVAQAGADKATIQRAIEAVLPPGVEVVTGQTVVNEQTGSIDKALGFFNTALLVFAFISLFVGAFTILNTFSILVGQRTKELALLRIVGASRKQVFRSVLGEAGIVGLVSSAIGIGLGALAALGLKALLKGFGLDLPPGPLVFRVRTVVVGLIVGVGVTVIAAISPARRAVRIPPVAAITEQQGGSDVSFTRRFTIGGSIAVLGAVLLGIGLAGGTILLVGLGALLLFVGVAMLSPAVARPVASVIGRPLAAGLGVAGRLGRENSMRSPRRTAQTASALMIGLALVSAISVFGASVSKSATSAVDNAFRANLIVTGTGQAQAGSFSTTLPARLAAVPGVTAALTAYQGDFEIRQSVQSLTAVSTQGLSQTLIVDMTSGSAAALGTGQLLLDSTTASNDNLKVGDTVPVKFALTGAGTMTVGGIYKANALIGSYLVGESFYLAHYSTPELLGVLLKTDGSAAVESQVKQTLAGFPTVQVQTKAAFEKAQAKQVNQLLGVVYALLGLAVIIALIGIVNTLMLSVFERTHEIGLLRAVGMKRRQIRTMIRSEAVILAIFGALIGIVIGTGLGIALVKSLSSSGINATAVPGPSLVLFLVLAALLGLLAATWPARRAARLDVLDAIATN